jgi:predicted transcriptional regulator
MNVKGKIKNYIFNSERNFAHVQDWGKDSVNGILKIDMGKYATMDELKRELKISSSSISRACKQLEKENIVQIEKCVKPFIVHLKEKHLYHGNDQTYKI